VKDRFLKAKLRKLKGFEDFMWQEKDHLPIFADFIFALKVRFPALRSGLALGSATRETQHQPTQFSQLSQLSSSPQAKTIFCSLEKKDGALCLRVETAVAISTPTEVSRTPCFAMTLGIDSM
jgi:hypothetical protein